MAENETQMALSPRQVLDDQRVRRIPGSAMRIGTWNVKTLYEAGKCHNLIQEMHRLRLNVLGVSETRWKNSGQFRTGNMVIYYSGNNDHDHRNGVAIMIDENTNKAVTNFVPLSDRVMMIQLLTRYGKLNIVQLYAPTMDKHDDVVESFFAEVDKVQRLCKEQDVTVVMGDFNSKVGKGKEGDYLGEFGLGERNERGERLLQFCQEKDMIIANTFFKLPKRRLYTWTSPASSAQNIIRNQIDYILINKRYRNAIKSVKTYPGADIASDHNPLIANFSVRLKKVKKTKKEHKIDVAQLKDPMLKEELTTKINKNMEGIGTSIQNEDINEKWLKLRTTIIETSHPVLTKKRQHAEKQWMTKEILNLMEERRKFKGEQLNKYKETHKLIRNKIRLAKEAWYREKCTEIEELQEKHDTFNVHKKVKELSGKQQQKQVTTLRDKNGNIIADITGKLKRWEEYIEELFADTRQQNLEQTGEISPDITNDEVINAIKNMKNNKSPGPDQIPAEIFKLIDQNHIWPITNILNAIYKTGIIPKEWLMSTFVAIPKKPNAKECSDHRTISLMCHILKIFLKIIHKRVYNKLEEDISESQFGFRNAMGTREALFALNVLIQRCLDVNQDLFVCFLDYNKAFDCVRHDILMKILSEKHIDFNDMRIISNLYYNQRAVFREGEEMSNEIKIERGVRQGCVLSPILFNLYSEKIMQEAISEETAGIRVNGELINNIRFADDTLVIAQSSADLQRMMDKIVNNSEIAGLTLNIKKTKHMIISKAHVQGSLYIRNEEVERVREYKYLGTMLNETGGHSREIRCRIGQARAAFANMRKVFCTRDLSVKLKIRLAKCYVFSILLYGMESWTTNKDDLNRLQAFEMWVYRRILRVSWTERVTNAEILRRVGGKAEIVNTVKSGKLAYLGHVMRGERYHMLQLIIQGKIQGKRSVGRRRTSWLKNLREWYHCTSIELFRAAASKARIAMMVANLLRGDGT